MNLPSPEASEMRLVDGSTFIESSYDANTIPKIIRIAYSLGPPPSFGCRAFSIRYLVNGQMENISHSPTTHTGVETANNRHNFSGGEYITDF
jgi:hypothetical protein